MSKKMIFGISILLSGIVAVIVFLAASKNNEDINTLDTKETESTATIHQNRAVWASNAKTIEELVQESDLVVRVRVSENPVTRVVHIESLMNDEQGNITDQTMVIKVLFSDTVFEVLKTYTGKPSLKITVMQTGGFDPTVSRGIEETVDDALYKVGEEYILFLVDISGDHIHAPDRELYRIVNPFGRYRIDGKKAFSYGQDNRPGVFSVKELEAHIRSVLNHKLPFFTPTNIPVNETTISPTATSEPEATSEIDLSDEMPTEPPFIEVTSTPAR